MGRWVGERGRWIEECGYEGHVTEMRGMSRRGGVVRQNAVTFTVSSVFGQVQ